MSQMRLVSDQEAFGMILDDEALVERVAKALWIAETNPPHWAIKAADAIGLVGTGKSANYTKLSRAAIEAVRVHMWDDGR